MRSQGHRKNRGRTAGIMLLTVATAAMIFLGGCASSRGRITAAVLLTIFSSEAGDVYIDGELVASLEAGEEHRQSILMGTYRVEMQFADGRRQREQVTVPQTMVVEFWREYQIGDRGPAGGWVFFIDTGKEFEWAYLEAAPVETEWTDRGGLEPLVGRDAQGTAIGTGATNTAAIVAQYGNREPTESRSDYAAKLANDLVVDYEGDVFDDWFLPSRDELNLMYENLYSKGVGGFASGAYWSSSETDGGIAWHQSFTNGNQSSNLFNYFNVDRVRAVRAFGR